jgi:hypothetical protein
MNQEGIKSTGVRMQVKIAKADPLQPSASEYMKEHGEATNRAPPQKKKSIGD